MANNLGRHILAEYYDCDPQVLDDLEAVERFMKEAATFAGATIVQSAFHRFNPHGISGVVVISESHLAIHTWPEYGYAAVDLFTCGDAVDPWKAHAFLTRRFGAGRTDTQELLRGVLPGREGPIHHKPVAPAAA
ncbi:MAG: adenosylmethionine decarboxylase [Deferrisomatales bacterium]